MSLGRRMANGATWMVALRFFKRSIGIVSTIVLARLLVPEDFGIVAMAAALMTLVVMFSELGVDTVLVRKPTVDNVDLDSAWSLQVTLGALQALMLLALAAPMAQFYDEPRLEPLIYVLSLAVFIQSFRNIGIVAFRREMTFNKEFILGGSVKATSFIVTVPLAVILQSYWALVMGIVASKVAHVGLSYAMHPYRPRWSRERWRELFGFSKWLLINNALQFLTQRGPIFVLGRLGGAQSAGIFHIAYDLAMLTTSELVTPINRAMLPGYARMNSGEGRLTDGYLDVLGIVAVIALPCGLGIAATATVLVPFALGQQWNVAVPVVETLASAGAIMCLLANTAPAFLALGRPSLVTFLGVIRNLVLLPGLIFGALHSGINGVATAILATTILMAPLNFGLVVKTLGIPWTAIIFAVIRPIFAAGSMYLLLHIYLVPHILIGANIAIILQALFAVSFGAVAYVTVLLTLWALFGGRTSAEAYLIEFVGQALPGIRRTLLARISALGR